VKRSSTLDVAQNKKPAAGGGNGLLGYHAFVFVSGHLTFSTHTY